MNGLIRLTFALVALLAASPSWGQGKGLSPSRAPEDGAPLKVTSQEMVTDKKSNTIVFLGSVRAVKGNLVINTDEMTVYTSEDQREFKKIKAKGSVKIISGDKTATGSEAEYYAYDKAKDQEERIEIRGNATLEDGKNKASGNQVVYYFETEDMKISGDKATPSEIIFFPAGSDASSGSGENESQPSQPTSDGGLERVTIKQETLFTGEAAPKKPDPASKKVQTEVSKPATLPGGKYMIQVAAYKDWQEAEKLAMRITDKVLSAHVEEAVTDSGKWYRVRLGGFKSLEEAQEVSDRLREEMNLKPFVIQSGK